MTAPKDPAKIRRMFGEISPRYDFLNHLLSLNLDRAWRRRAVRALRLPPRARVLDACTGTADLALELESALRASGGRVTGTDFAPEMLRIAQAKRARRERRGAVRLDLAAADSLALPFADGSFDAVTVAFGVRNLCDLEGGLREVLRVLKPGGEAAILEFSPPGRGWPRRLFEAYFHHVLPRIGRWVTGTRAGGEAYSYLPASVGGFPQPDQLSRLLVTCGFTNVRLEKLTLGVAVLHLAARSTAVSLPAPALASAGRTP